LHDFDTSTQERTHERDERISQVGVEKGLSELGDVDQGVKKKFPARAVSKRRGSPHMILLL
jgi:hypothetical protein